MSTHLQNMRRSFLELEDRGMTFTEAHKVYVVLSSLDSSWDVLVTSLESMQERDLTMAYLIGRLLEEEQKWLERHPGKGGENAQHRPASTTVQNAGRAPETVNTVKRCYRCGSTEHLQRGYPERRNRGAARQGHRTTQHMWSGSPASFSLAASMTEDTRNTWLLNSGQANI
ncbi:hypothetical protein E2320_000087 [Naja naja]|nr:hypothetical protein E2320_000087 [Naja naja]